MQYRPPIWGQAVDSQGGNVAVCKAHRVGAGAWNRGMTEGHFHVPCDYFRKRLQFLYGHIIRHLWRRQAKAVDVDHCTVLLEIGFFDCADHCSRPYQSRFFFAEQNEHQGFVRTPILKGPVEVGDGHDPRPVVNCATTVNNLVVMRADDYLVVGGALLNYDDVVNTTAVLIMLNRYGVVWCTKSFQQGTGGLFSILVVPGYGLEFAFYFIESSDAAAGAGLSR